MGSRSIVTLACADCKQRNYSKTRNKKGQSQKIEASKFCPFCRKHTLHKELK